MKIFVAGGTGVVGRRAVPRLVAEGHAVTVAARTPEKADLVRSWGAEPVEVDLFDPHAVRAAVEGHDVVVNLATSIPPFSKAARAKAWATNDRLRREASRNLVDAALAAGAERYVQESVSFLYADGGDGWIAEDHPVAPNSVTASALDAEAQARRFADAGGTAVVLRFGSFYGPDSSHTADVVRFARRGLGTTPGPRDGYVSSVSTDDAAAAVVIAATQAPGGTYNVVDDEPLTRAELDEVLAAAVGRKRLRPVPNLAVRLLGDKLDHVVRSHRVSNRALRSATGWTPRYPSGREGFAALVSDRPAVDVGVALDEAEPAVEPVRRLP
ncbi:MAG TPA: NAD(P)-dependent oxidoreductase [Acidimicrobiales bacterium]|nr:NAD(P)-dependent oxidoreductase [Acidimicrobiales bacterium]